MLKTRVFRGAVPQVKKKPGRLSALPDQRAIECTDGELRPAQKWEGAKMRYFVPPGTPITNCAQCGARIIRMNRSQLHGRVLILDYSQGEGSELNAFYAPLHIC